MNMAILGGIPHLIAHVWLQNCCRDVILSIYRCWSNLPAELQPHNPGYARETQSWQYGKMLGDDFVRVSRGHESKVGSSGDLGMKLRDLPFGYLAWLLKMVFPIGNCHFTKLLLVYRKVTILNHILINEYWI